MMYRNLLHKTEEDINFLLTETGEPLLNKLDEKLDSN